MMKRLSIAVLLFGALLMVGPSVRAQVSFGIRIGPPPAPRIIPRRPPPPSPDYIWVDGYWYPVGNHYRWHEGYWTLPPYDGAHWVGPHYEGGEFFRGYWDGDRGRFEHDHRWDRDHDRDGRRFGDQDSDRDHDRDHDRGEHH